MRPNPPLFCADCGTRIPNRRDRRGERCNDCTLASARCPACGQITSDVGEHRCASVDARGTRHCEDCGKRLSNTGYQRYLRRCPQCEKRHWRDYERDLRARLRQAFGGACQRCGYARCMAALHFHHKDPATKRSKRGWIREVERHPERFELLCANCHIEHHADEPAEARPPARTS